VEGGDWLIVDNGGREEMHYRDITAGQCCCRVGGVEGGCAGHLAVEFCAVVILLTC